MPQPRRVVERRWMSHPGNVHHARVALREAILPYVRDEIDLIELAIGEACANAIEHGSPSGEANSFTVRCLIEPDQCALTIEVEDEGADFDLDALTPSRTPDLTSEGGRGLFLMHAIMDEVALHNSDRGLRVRMVKHVSMWPAEC
jgi:serine/threonine-protein kinase RsbW